MPITLNVSRSRNKFILFRRVIRFPKSVYGNTFRVTGTKGIIGEAAIRGEIVRQAR